jgi:probable addiction module antidote protein
MTRPILNELWQAARDRGVVNVARDTGIPRSHFYRLFSDKGNPSLDTILRIAKALGFTITINRGAPSRGGN